MLVTDDDCTVAPDWVGRGWVHMSKDPEQIVTGRVLPAGDPSAVPSLIDDPEPRNYTGEIHFGALYTNNCCLNRGAVLAIGGFDELIRARRRGQRPLLPLAPRGAAVALRT